MIRWAGISNTDVGMIIEHYPRVIIPNRNIEVQSVPGRNGDIVISTDSFSNYEQAYDAFLDVKHIGGLEAAIPKVSDWLLGNPGYHKLEDSYFPDVYRMAYFSGGAQFVSLLNEYGEGQLIFNCAPEKFLKYGDKEIVVQKNVKIINPTSFKAKPIIKIELKTKPQVPITITINGKNIQFNNIANINGSIIIMDVSRHTLKDDTEANLSSNFVSEYEDCELGKENIFTWTYAMNSYINRILLTPRWWTI